MLVNGYNDMKPFLPSVEMKGTPFVFDDALEVAQSKIVLEILGDDLEQQLEKEEMDDRPLLRLAMRAITLEAFLHSIPDLDLVLTDAGFAVVNNEKVTMASRDRVEALKSNTAAKLDDAKDALVAYLVRTSKYDGWRSSDQFLELSGALFLTFSDFRKTAVLTNTTAQKYPRSWTEYRELIPAMSVALMTDVASYISEDYAYELVEKLRTRSAMSPADQKILGTVKAAVAFYATGDPDTGRQMTLSAFSYMKANLDKYPTFAASDEARAVEITHEDTPIFSLF